MSMSTSAAESDWSAPATQGDLMSVKYDLEGRIDRVKADLQLEIKEVRVEMKDLQLGVFRMIWIAAGALTGVGILLRFF